jgi:Ca-activated chloride channel family protein
VPATAENVAEARKVTDELRGVGGTNINDALLTAIKTAPDGDSDRPYLIVFLTDGQPTVSVTDPDEILKNVARGNEGRIRLYVFGVGYDVNTRLLDLLAEQNRGTRDYVEPGEDLELKLSSFYRKVAEPVLADLSLSFSDLNVYDQYAPKLGDLFAGGELVVVGRYKGAGAKAVELTGTRRGAKERFVYGTTFPSEDRTHEFLPRLWATRKVGFLLDQIRLHGQDKELKDTIVQLATKYGIVTPYTAYLVTEPAGVAWRQGGRGNIFEDALASSDAGFDREEAGIAFGVLPPAPRGGRLTVPPALARGQVQASKGSASLRLATTPDDTLFSLRLAGKTIGQKKRDLVTCVGARTFYRVGERWVDADYNKNIETRRIEAFSEEYFELIRKHPDLAKCLALGERVIVMIGDTAYESVPAAED